MPSRRSWTSSTPSAPGASKRSATWPGPSTAWSSRNPLVPAEALTAALAGLDPAVRAALEESIKRARRFADAQRPADTDVELGEGAVVSQNWVPVARVGLYVPGGLAVYPSSVINERCPGPRSRRRIHRAGVPSARKTSTASRTPQSLPQRALLGIEEVYAIGGAQAIAAFAYGIPASAGRAGLDPVDVVTAQATSSSPPQASRQGCGGHRFRGRHHGDCDPGRRHGPSRTWSRPT